MTAVGEVIRKVVESPDGLVVFVGTASEPARPLWQTSFAESGRACVLLALDRPAADYGRPKRSELVCAIDTFTKNRGLLPSGDASTFESVISSSLNPKVTLFVDSVAALIAAWGLTTTVTMLTNWQRQAAAVACVAHEDVVDAFAIASLDRIARAVVRVGDGASPTTLKAPRPSLRLPCQVVLYKRTGKVVREASTLVLLPGGGVAFRAQAALDEDDAPVILAPTDAAPPQPPPQVEVSFNLSLTASQREARSKVVLPYTKAQAPAAAPTPIGSVTYHLDAADDFDEEDPDDDLDF